MTQGNVRQGEAGARADGCAPLPAMPALALDLTPDAVRLLRREGPPGPDAQWTEVARAAIDRDGNVRGISRLRSAAGGGPGAPGPEVAILMPPEQVLVRRLNLDDGPAIRLAAFDAVAAASGQPRTALAVAVSTEQPDGARLVLAIFLQSLREAIAYAEGWGFRPVLVGTAVEEAHRIDGGLAFLPYREESAAHAAPPSTAPARPERSAVRPRTVAATLAVAAALGVAAFLGLHAPPERPAPAPSDASQEAVEPGATLARSAPAAVEQHQARPSGEDASAAGVAGAASDLPPSRRAPSGSISATSAPPLDFATPLPPVEPEAARAAPDFARSGVREDPVASRAPADAPPKAPAWTAPGGDREIAADTPPGLPERPPHPAPLRARVETAPALPPAPPHAASRDPGSRQEPSPLAIRDPEGPSLPLTARVALTDPEARGFSPAAAMPHDAGPVPKAPGRPPHPPADVEAPETGAATAASEASGGADEDLSDLAAIDPAAIAPPPARPGTDAAPAADPENTEDSGPPGPDAPTATPVPRPRTAEEPAADAPAPEPSAPAQRPSDAASTAVRVLSDGSIRVAPPIPDPIAEAHGEEIPDEPPTAQAALAAPVPRARPEGIGAPIRPSAAGEARTARALPGLTRRVPLSVERAARGTGIPLDSTALIGVLNLDTGRQALLRMPDGKYHRIGVGDDVSGWKVISISPNRINLERGGLEKTLVLVTR